LESALASALALDASLWEAQKVGLDGPTVREAQVRRRRLALLKEVHSAMQEEPEDLDPVKLRDAIAAAKEGGVDKEVIDEASKKLSQAQLLQRSNARDDLIAACGFRDVEHLTEAIEHAVACGVERTLVIEARGVMEETKRFNELKQRSDSIRQSRLSNLGIMDLNQLSHARQTRGSAFGGRPSIRPSLRPSVVSLSRHVQQTAHQQQGRLRMSTTSDRRSAVHTRLSGLFGPGESGASAASSQRTSFSRLEEPADHEEHRESHLSVPRSQRDSHSVRGSIGLPPSRVLPGSSIAEEGEADETR
jgi:hypothetical protein